jgi:transcriptional regulator GlxA family with amidase domain
MPIEHLRLEAARALMEDTSHSIDVVAQQAGFADRDPHAARLPADLWTAAAGDPAGSRRMMPKRGACHRNALN